MKNRMKLVAPLRLLLLLALVCALAGAGELATSTGVAYAASSHSHITHQAHILDICNYGMAEMDDADGGVICFNATWGLLPDGIASINTGNHIMKLIWKDEDFQLHTSVFPAGTIIEQGHGLTDGWAGHDVMDPQSINLMTNAAAYKPGRTCPYGMAEMDDLQQGVGCFLSHRAPSVNFVHIANTGSHSMGWAWEDCDGGPHTMGTKPPGYYLVVNKPPAPGCTADMYLVDRIAIS